ncbi:MAG: response regulator transcription factor [Clostridia bacterium]|nr:response regulator transcription factor [Clostridia bacterium]
MAYRIHIVDDSPSDTEYLLGLTEDFSKKRGLDFDIRHHSSAESFLFCYEEDKTCDLLLLDIEMPGMDGVTLAKHIRSKNEKISIVFITGYSDYIGEGYDVSALHYLMKPVSKEKFEQVLDRALSRRQMEDRTVIFKANSETVCISLSCICYFESFRNYVNAVTEDGKVYTIRGTLSSYEDQVDSRFMRVGRSYLVNLTKLRRISKTEMTFPNGSVLPVPRGYYGTINQAIIKKL